MLSFPWDKLKELGLEVERCHTCDAAAWSMLAEMDGRPLMVSCRVCYRQYQLLTWAQEVAYHATELARLVESREPGRSILEQFATLQHVLECTVPIVGTWPRLVCTYEGMEPNDDDTPF